MPNFIRQLAIDDSPIPMGDLYEALKKNKRTLELSAIEGSENNWARLRLAHKQGDDIAIIHRLPITRGSPGEQLIGRFRDEIKTCRPESAAKWLAEYLPNVKCIYAFEIRDGAHTNNGFGAIHTLRMTMQERAGGIIQSDNEGFSNDLEYHILWQFPPGAKGAWWMALMKDGQWINFQMQLSNQKQRDAFLNGQVPPGAVFE